MGADNSPDAFVRGAVRAIKETGVEIILFGKEAELCAGVEKLGYRRDFAGLHIENADDVVDPHDDPSNIVRTRPESSMVRGLRFLAEGNGDAFVSAGNTGALLTAATLIAKRIRGIRRAAFCPVVPTASGRAIIVDAGANSVCTPEYLLQFACMGSVYAQKMLNIDKPRVALLNIGTEECKGDDLRKETHKMLSAAGEHGVISFTGNIEARDVPLGGADVVVCDGFSGNVLLKSIEGTALFMSGMLKSIFMKNVFSKAGALLCRSGISGLKKKMDYRETGGSVLLGISKPVIKAHGSSDEVAVYNAIRQASYTAERGVCDIIRENIGLISSSGGI